MPTAKVAPAVSGLVGIPFYVDARASTGAKDHQWDVLDARPTTADITISGAGIAVITATEPATFVLRLTVTDEAGGSDAALSLATVVRPTVTLDAPTEVAQYDSFVVNAKIPEQIGNAVCTWTIAPPDEADLRVSPRDPCKAVVIPHTTGDLRVTASLVVETSDEPMASGTSTVSVTAPAAGDAGDALYWQEQIVANNRAALANVRASATTWQGMLTGVLGLFGTVTVLGAPGALDQIGSRSMAYLAVALLVGGFLAAVLAVVIVTKIIASGVRVERTPDPEKYGQDVIRSASAATDNLARSKTLAFSAASLIAGAGLVLALAQLGGGGATGSDAPVALVRTTTATLCGPMSVDPQSGALLIAGQKVGATRSVEIVDACAGQDAAKPATTQEELPSYGTSLGVAAVLIGCILAFANVWRRRWVAPVVGAALVYLLAWSMSGQAFTWWHLWALLAGGLVVVWRRIQSGSPA